MYENKGELPKIQEYRMQKACARGVVTTIKFLNCLKEIFNSPNGNSVGVHTDAN